jgi:hypothetical protein
MITHAPDWPGMTHYLNVLVEDRPDLDEDYVDGAILAARRRLEAANPGKTYYEIGRDICQRLDVANTPWQLFIGLQEVSDAV